LRGGAVAEAEFDLRTEEERFTAPMKKICMVAYTNYLSDARPRREAEALVRRGDRVDFIALGEKTGPPSRPFRACACFV
jgi:hypothetical protein